MNIYNKFIEKQNEIIDLVNQQQEAEHELTKIKKEIFLFHKKRLTEKQTGKTTIVDDGFEIVYNRTEKVSLLNSIIEDNNFKSDCFVEKTTPEKKSLSFSKTEYKKLSDNEREKVDKYIVKELNKPSMTVKAKE